MDYKKSKAPVNTVTRDIMDLCDDTDNIYESVSIISKRANQISGQIKEDLSKKLAEFASYNDSLEEVFGLVTVHDDPAFGFQFPCTLVHIEHNHIHTQIAGSLLCTQTGAETVVEENQQASLVLAQRFILIAVLLDFERFLKGGIQVAQIKYISVIFHYNLCFMITFLIASQR